MLRLLRLLGITLSFLLSSPAHPQLPSPREKWIRTQTANFVLYGDAGESKIKEVGLELEKLRAVLASIRPSRGVSSPLPTEVFVFRSDSAFRPYKPRFQGRPIDLAAYFLASDVGNFIALSASWGTDPRRTVYHEYLHYFVHSNFLPQPAWYDEGLAEFYSTFRATGTNIEIGRPVEEHVQLLRNSTLLPLEKLFAVGRASSELNEGDRRGIFYAQSWALVHYLMRGKPELTPKLGQFLVRLQQGQPVDAAFRENFQTDYAALLGELRRYVQGSRFLYTVTTLSELDFPRQVSAERMSHEEVLVRLGHLLAHGPEDRLEDAEAHFGEVLGKDPAHAGALAGMGVLRIRQERYEEAAELLQKAIASGSDDFRVYFHHGELLLRPFHEATMLIGRLDARQRRAVDDARAAFRKSLELNERFAPARASLGRTFLIEEPSRVDEGIRALEAAVRQLPSQTDLALDLATLYERKGDRAKSEKIRREALGPEAASKLAKRREGSLDAVLDRVNALLAERREEEGIALFEKLLAAAPEDVREALMPQLEELRRGAARNQAARRFNEAGGLLNRQDLEGALAGFRSVAETAEDPELARAAREQVKRIEEVLSRRRAKRSTPKHNG